MSLAAAMADNRHHAIDSITVRGHVSAQKGDSRTGVWSRAGITSKISVHRHTQGRPLAFHLTGGEAADCTHYEVLIDLTEEAATALLGDKGYDTDPIRTDLKRRRVRAAIPPPAVRPAAIRWDIS